MTFKEILNDAIKALEVYDTGTMQEIKVEVIKRRMKAYNNDLLAASKSLGVYHNTVKDVVRKYNAMQKQGVK